MDWPWHRLSHHNKQIYSDVVENKTEHQTN